MRFLLISGSMIVPLLMYFLQRKWATFRLVFDVIAIISVLVFGNIASLSIYQIIKDNTVLMTNIHAVFLNPFFLITGAYMGIYIIYLLFISIGRDRAL